MGRFKVGAEVHDNDGFEGVIVGKPKKGWRDVAYQFGTVRVRKGELNFDRAGAGWAPKVCAEVCETEYKVGDRVRMAAEVGGEFTDVPGTVRGKNLFGESLLVEFDGDVGFGHDGYDDADVKLSSKRGWFISSDKLARVVAPATTADWTPSVGDRVRVKCEADVFAAGIEIGAVGVVGSVSGSTLHVDFELDGDTFPQFAFLHQVEPLPVAPQPAGTTFTVKDGGTYVDRDGNKIGPVEVDGVVGHCVSFGGDNWAVSGVFNTYHPDEAPERDLVAEWVEPAPPTTWAPVAGKFGKTRDGRKVGPMRKWDEEKFDCADEGEEGTFLWHADGRGLENADLIAEWPADVAEAPVAEAGATATPFALEAGKFYETATGKRSGPMRIWATDVKHPFEDENGYIYRPDGTSQYGGATLVKESPAALVEVVETTATPLFKKGDILECVDGDHEHLTQGKVYEAQGDAYGKFVQVKMDNGNTGGMYLTRFRLATPHAKFKVGDRVERKESWHAGMVVGDKATVTEVRADGAVRLSEFPGANPANTWHDDDNLALTPPLTIGTTVTLSAPAKIAGIYGDDANLSVNGAMFTLPLASLVAA